MPSINITNFGGFYTTGNAVFSIALGDDGSVFVAGGKNVGIPGNGPDRDMDLAIFCYKNGVLQWEKIFGGPYKYEAFMSLSYKDGYVYASGGVGYGFRTSEDASRGVDGLPDSTWPANKPFFPERNGLEPDSEVGQPTLATVFVKLDATTGETIIDGVVPEETPGNLGISSIDADSDGNIYVTSANKLFTYESNGTLKSNTVHADSAVKAINGANWVQAGSRVTKIDSTGSLLKDYFPKSDNEDELGISDFAIDANGDIIVALQKQDLSKGNLPEQLWALGLNPQKGDIPPGLVTTQIRKISGHTGEFLWTTTINEECISAPSSISLTQDGKIVVTGWTIGDLNGGDDNGEKSFGTFDAFFVTLEDLVTTGKVIRTQIIGTPLKGESISKGIFDPDGNMYLAGEFDSKYFDLKGSGFQNVYLISDTKFTLMGDEMDNIIHGGGGSDVIDGGAGDDVLYGADGNDNVEGGVGDDLIVGGDGAGNDTYNGGIGTDTVRYSSAEAGITVNLSLKKDQAKSTSADAGIGIDQMSLIENVIGGIYSDLLTGSSVANVLIGASGNDVIDGGGGADVLHGGEGDDVYYVDNVNDRTLEDRSETDGSGDISREFEEWLAANPSWLVDNGFGGIQSQVITSSAAFPELEFSNPGKARGFDYWYENFFEFIDAGGDDLVSSSVARVLGQNLENLTLTGKAAINGTGNALDNVIRGNGAANVLDGGAGTDMLFGGAGNDTYLVDSTTDTITEAVNAGTDTVRSSVNFSLVSISNVENLIYTGSFDWTGAGNTSKNTINGGVGNDSIMGGADADTLIGGAGNDTLDGGTDADKMTGGTGDDVYVLDNTKDSVTEKTNEGTDTISTTLASFSITKLSSIENLTYTGSGDALLTGNASVNRLTGNSGADRLDGSIGGDSLIGGSGNDLYIVDDVNDTIIEALNEGTDSVQSGVTFTLSDYVENLTLTGKGLINGTGNNQGNIITGNTAANTLNGGLGTDTLDGGAGNDTLSGGDGADIFRFSTALGKVNIDTITDFATGIDRIDLDDAIFRKFIGTSGQLNADKFTPTSETQGLTDYIVAKTVQVNGVGSTALFYDADGSGKGAAIQFATLVGIGFTDISATDFWIV
jgi:Ca2+-binding RTX toxin-like protein